jgi:TctA family transporter
MLAVLGITFVASLSGKDFLKGLISGGIGLFLATVGLDPMSGIQRYTFGQTFLWDGIGLVPITLGFFAIPEVVDLAVRGSTIAGGRVEKLGGVMEGVKDTFRHWWLVIRCSAIAAYTAIIPGIGGATTQWLAYAHAVQSSPDKERFGKGAVEGVLGPGAADHSTLGGSLITTVAFGVPASITTAILLGAFLIHGLVPGPDMLIPEPKGHLALTFSFVWITVISNIITTVICLLILNQLVRVTQIRASLILPPIIMLVFLGAFAEKNSFEDLLLVLILGGLGWVLARLNWPRPPLILGLVLGPLAENRLFLSTDNFGITWLLRPGVLAIGCLTLVGAFYPILRRWQERKKKKGQPSVPKTVSPNESLRPKLNWAVIFALLIVLALVWALWESRRFNFRAGLFPWAIGFPLLGLVIAQSFKELWGKVSRAGKDITGEESEIPSSVANRRTRDIFLWIAGYFVAIWLFGFSVGVTLCTFAQLRMGAREKWSLSLILTALTWAFTYGLFDHVLHIPFPEGYVSQWLNVPSIF